MIKNIVLAYNTKNEKVGIYEDNKLVVVCQNDNPMSYSVGEWLKAFGGKYSEPVKLILPSSKMLPHPTTDELLFPGKIIF